MSEEKKHRVDEEPTPNWEDLIDNGLVNTEPTRMFNAVKDEELVKAVKEAKKKADAKPRKDEGKTLAEVMRDVRVQVAKRVNRVKETAGNVVATVKGEGSRIKARVLKLGKNKKGVGLLVSIICLSIIMAVASPFHPSKASAESSDADTAVQDQLYIAYVDGQDRVVRANGKVSGIYAVDEKGNIVTATDGLVVAKASDVQRAVVIKVEVEVDSKDDEQKSDEITYPFEGVITGRGVRMRAVPSTEGRIIQEFLPDTHITVVGGGGDWYRVLWSHDGEEEEGFIHEQYIRKAIGAN